jgi:hypothetical protein
MMSRTLIQQELMGFGIIQLVFDDCCRHFRPSCSNGYVYHPDHSFPQEIRRIVSLAERSTDTRIHVVAKDNP